MEVGETTEETMKREIQEEIGEHVKYKILKRSSLNLIYEWPIDMQKAKGLKGQARISYWIKYIEGVIKIQEEELKKFQWVKEIDLLKVLKQSNWEESEYKTFFFDWEAIKKDFKI